jgi:hypothetical protein
MRRWYRPCPGSRRSRDRLHPGLASAPPPPRVRLDRRAPLHLDPPARRLSPPRGAPGRLPSRGQRRGGGRAGRQRDGGAGRRARRRAARGARRARGGPDGRAQRRRRGRPRLGARAPDGRRRWADAAPPPRGSGPRRADRCPARAHRGPARRGPRPGGRPRPRGGRGRRRGAVGHARAAPADRSRGGGRRPEAAALAELVETSVDATPGGHLPRLGHRVGRGPGRGIDGDLGGGPGEPRPVDARAAAPTGWPVETVVAVLAGVLLVASAVVLAVVLRRRRAEDQQRT